MNQFVTQGPASHLFVNGSCFNFGHSLSSNVSPFKPTHTASWVCTPIPHFTEHWKRKIRRVKPFDGYWVHFDALIRHEIGHFFGTHYIAESLRFIVFIAFINDSSSSIYINLDFYLVDWFTKILQAGLKIFKILNFKIFASKFWKFWMFSGSVI